ncbi:hypothetical protein [Arthrobacter oryzae]|uniref:hypothetical protein n=1 Tax=Arthrobacter oryzae TaxID=409290 RepID=UPI00285AE2CF|nr:hypothetical protein [Arthrobacter oryzae]MDR6504668.1 hypothetical protein [Arthrobacter oryzae]
MCNGRLVLCVLAVLSLVAAGVLSLAGPASAAPCPDKQVPAAAGGFCVKGGPPSPAPTSSAPSPADPDNPGSGQGGARPAETQPAATGSDVESVPSREAVSGLGSSPTPIASPRSPSAAAFAAPPAAAPTPSRSTRMLTAALPDSGRAEAGSIPVAGYLVAIGGGMLVLSSAFGFMRFRPAARARS